MNRVNMNTDNVIDEIIKDARDYLIKSRLHVGTAVSVGYKSVRAAFYVLESEETAEIRNAMVGLDSELEETIPTKDKAFEEEKERLLELYAEAVKAAEAYIKQAKPVSATGMNRYRTVDNLLCQLNMERIRIKHISLEDIKALKKTKLNFDGLLAMKADGKAVKAAKPAPVKKLSPGKNAGAKDMDGYIEATQEADKAAAKKNKKAKEKLMKDIELALEADKRVTLKLKATEGSLSELARFKVLGLAERDGETFVMVRNPWDEGRVSYDKKKGSGRTVATVKNEDESGALYIKESMVATLMEIV
ncbi:MAG: hypothetical protein IKO61_12475 [Lachnospiraceae bacterium]|nr:hypothetical protein [Lachnospiraceae bacterium]